MGIHPEAQERLPGASKHTHRHQGVPKLDYGGPEQTILSRVSGVSGTVTCSRGASKTLAIPGPSFPPPPPGPAPAATASISSRSNRTQPRTPESRHPQRPGHPEVPTPGLAAPTRSPRPYPGFWSILWFPRGWVADREAAWLGKGMEVEKPQL